MRAAYEKYQDQGFEVLSVSIQEGDAEVAEFVARHGVSYPMLMDRSGAISASYEITSTPTTYFIAPDGTIADSTSGVVSRQWLESNIGDYVGV